MGDKLTVDALSENIPEVMDYIDRYLEKTECPEKIKGQVNIAADEIISNIIKYAYASETGDITVIPETDENTLSLTFTDRGRRFNPLETEDPDTSLTADQRDPGGLGIFMVKKLMDEVRYEYKDGQNILTIIKRF